MLRLFVCGYGRDKIAQHKEFCHEKTQNSFSLCRLGHAVVPCSRDTFSSRHEVIPRITVWRGFFAERPIMQCFERVAAAVGVI